MASVIEYTPTDALRNAAQFVVDNAEKIIGNENRTQRIDLNFRIEPGALVTVTLTRDEMLVRDNGFCFIPEKNE